MGGLSNCLPQKLQAFWATLKFLVKNKAEKKFENQDQMMPSRCLEIRNGIIFFGINSRKFFAGRGKPNGSLSNFLGTK